MHILKKQKTRESEMRFVRENHQLNTPTSANPKAFPMYQYGLASDGPLNKERNLFVVSPNANCTMSLKAAAKRK